MTGRDDGERVRLLVLAKRFDDAVREAHLLLGVAPDDWYVLCWLSRAYRGVGDVDNALAAARSAVAFAPDSDGALENLVQMVREYGVPREALALAEHLVSRAPNSALAWTRLAECCPRAHKRSRGIQAAKRAIELDPHSSAAFNALAMNQVGRTAQRSYQKAIELDPGGSAARHNLAANLDKANEHALAGELLGGLIREDPSNQEVASRMLAIALQRQDPKRQLVAIIVTLLLGGLLIYAAAVGRLGVRPGQSARGPVGWIALIMVVTVASALVAMQKNRSFSHGLNSTLDATVEGASDRYDMMRDALRTGRLLPHSELPTRVGLDDHTARWLRIRVRRWSLLLGVSVAAATTLWPSSVAFADRFEPPQHAHPVDATVVSVGPLIPLPDGKVDDRRGTIGLRFVDGAIPRSMTVQVRDGAPHSVGQHVAALIADSDRSVWIRGVTHEPAWIALSWFFVLMLGVPVGTMSIVRLVALSRCRRALTASPPVVTPVEKGGIVERTDRSPGGRNRRTIRAAVRIAAPGHSWILRCEQVVKGRGAELAVTCWSGPVRLVAGRSRRFYLLSMDRARPTVFTLRAPRSLKEFLQWESGFVPTTRPPVGRGGAR